MSLTPEMLANMSPADVLAYVARIEAEKANAEAEAKLAKSKTKAKEFNPNTCDIFIKPETGTLNVRLGKGVGKFGTLTMYPEGALRLLALLDTGRLSAFLNDNKAKLLEMNAAWLNSKEAKAEETASA